MIPSTSQELATVENPRLAPIRTYSFAQVEVIGLREPRQTLAAVILKRPRVEK